MGKKIFVFIISAMMTVCYVSAQKIEPPQILIADDSVACGEVVQIPVILNNAGAFCAFQFSLILPEGITPVADSDSVFTVTGGELIADHEIHYNCVDNSLIVGCVSMTNSVFKADSGVVCYISLMADTLKETVIDTIVVTDMEVSTPGVERLASVDDYSFTLKLIAYGLPGFSINVSPFTFSGSIESAIVIESSVDISSIAFKIKIPELFAERKLINLFSHLMATDFKTDIAEIDDCTYSVLIQALSDSVILSGTTTITGISVDRAIALIPADVYVFYLDDIAVTTADGTVYRVAPIEYALDLTKTRVESMLPESDESVTYYSLDGRRISSPGKGVTLVRHADGRVTKIINR